MADYTSSKTGAQIDTILGGTFASDVTINGLTVGAGGGNETTNTAFGVSALYSNTTGAENTAIGRSALYSNTIGSNNTASGRLALRSNTTGDNNVASGYHALYSNTTGDNNVASGLTALYSNTTGDNNVASGLTALYSNTTGNNNVGIGRSALYSNTTGSDNIAFGRSAQSTSGTVSGQCTLGSTSITNLRCNDTSISSLSDERDKTNIIDIPLGLDFINTLRPVSFNWDRRDGSMVGKKDFGFIAQELKAAQEATVYSDSMRLVCEDNPERIEADPMKTYPVLVKAIQELSAKVAELEAKLAV